jgi:hypothetical protein
MADPETDTLETEDQAGETEENESLLSVTPEEPTEDNYEAPPHLEADAADAAVEEAKPPAEQPEWIEDRHWDSEKGEVKTEEMAKAYKSLREKMDSGKHKAPKDGKYALDNVGFEPDDEILLNFVDKASDLQLSQDQFESLISFYAESQGEIEQAITYQKDEEMKKLGKNADGIIKSMESWLAKFGTSGVLSNEEIDTIANASTSATFINALNKIRRSYGEVDIPPASAGLDVGVTSMDEIQELMADPKYGSDMAYTQKVEKKVYEMHGEKI